MKLIDLKEAGTNLSKLIEEVQEGKEVIISNVDKPIAKLVPFDLNTHNTQPRDMTQRIWKGEIWIADDADILP